MEINTMIRMKIFVTVFALLTFLNLGVWAQEERISPDDEAANAVLKKAIELGDKKIGIEKESQKVKKEAEPEDEEEKAAVIIGRIVLPAQNGFLHGHEHCSWLRPGLDNLFHNFSGNRCGCRSAAYGGHRNHRRGCRLPVWFLYQRAGSGQGRKGRGLTIAT
jgi:hypothetical protein